MMQRALSGAWNTWYSNAMEAKAQEQALRRGLMRLVNSKLGAGFGSWREQAAQQKEALQREAKKELTEEIFS